MIRRLRFLLPCLAVAFCVGGCGGDNLKKASIRYSPPAVYPVREKITDAQKHAKAEASAAADALKAIAKAQKVAPANVPDLQEALAEASGQVNQVVAENGLLQSALDGAQKRADDLEQKVGTQTDSLNSCVDDKNTLIDQVRDLKAAAIIHDRKYHRLKFGVCGLAAAAVTYLASKLGLFGLLRKLTLLGPWGMAGAIAGAVAIPGIVFAVLWRIL